MVGYLAELEELVFDTLILVFYKIYVNGNSEKDYGKHIHNMLFYFILITITCNNVRYEQIMCTYVYDVRSHVSQETRGKMSHAN